MSSESTASFELFGGAKPWVPPAWKTTDDRIRGGSSISYLSAAPNNTATFYGTLDTKSLGGAGFASQFSPVNGAGDNDEGRESNAQQEPGEASNVKGWDLSAYDGVELELGEADTKSYTLILKDELSAGTRSDGREKAGISWEAEIKASESGLSWIPWQNFKATYRGKEKPDAGEVNAKEIKRIGIMMRSYFGEQEGDFRVVLKSLVAKSKADVDARASIVGDGTILKDDRS